MDTNDARGGLNAPSNTSEDRIYQALLETLSAERAAAGLTVAQLAERSKVPARTLVRYLSGEREIPGRALTKIASGLGLSMVTIWRRAEDRASDR